MAANLLLALSYGVLLGTKPVTMTYQKLGSSDLTVSSCCLGTMTWGNQNTDEEAAAQLNLAWDMGCNFLDTAEISQCSCLHSWRSAVVIVVRSKLICLLEIVWYASMA